jgi:hypothetical protein
MVGWVKCASRSVRIYNSAKWELVDSNEIRIDVSLLYWHSTQLADGKIYFQMLKSVCLDTVGIFSRLYCVIVTINTQQFSQQGVYIIR